MQNPDRLTAPAIKTSILPQLNEPEWNTLDNNIPLFLFEDHSNPAVRFDIILNAGSLVQHKKLVAITTNNMLREGSLRLNSHQINNRIEYHGAHLTLNASKDRALISLLCLQKSVRHLLPLLAELFFEPDFAEKPFTIYNKRQKQAFILGGKRSRQLAQRHFNKLVFGNESLYGQIAEEEDFDLIQIEDLKKFHAGYYQNAPLQLIMSGAITKEMPEMVNSLFGQHHIKDISLPEAAIVEKAAVGIHEFKAASSLQSAIMMGRQIMRRDHPDYSSFIVLNTLLGGYFGSRLMSNIREDKGYTYGIYSQMVNYRHSATFAIASEVGAGVTDAAIAEIRNELQKLIDEEVSEDELQLVKNYLNGSYLRGLDGIYNQAEKFHVTLEIDRKMEYFTKSLAEMNNTNPQKLQKLAKQWLQADEMLTVVVK